MAIGEPLHAADVLDYFDPALMGLAASLIVLALEAGEVLCDLLWAVSDEDTPKELD